MEVGLGQDVVALSHTTRTVKKRPASPLDAGSHTFKRPSHSVDTGTPLLNLAYWCDTSPLRNPTDSWDLETAIDRSILFQLESNCVSYQQQSLYEYNVPTGFYTTGASGQHHLAGSGGESGSVLHSQPTVHRPDTDPPSYKPPHHTSTSGIASRDLPLAPTSRVFPLGLQPACAHDHTPPYTPSLPVISRLNVAYPTSTMHVPITHDVNGANQPPAAYTNAQHTQNQVSEQTQWSIPVHGLPLNDQASTAGVADYNQRTLPSMSYVGHPPRPTHSLNCSTGSPNNPFPSGPIQYSFNPVMASENSYATYNNEHSHGSMSVPGQGREQGAWPGHDSLPIRAISPEQNERRMPVFGPYVGVIHASDEQDHGQADGTALSDVEEIMAAQDDQRDAMGGIKRSTSDESLGTSWNISSGTPSGSSSVEELMLATIPAVGGSYVHLPYPTAPRYGSDQNDTSYYRHNGDSATDVRPPVGIEYVQENPAYPQKQKKPRKDRGRFDRDALDETNETRKLKACVTCRKQKIRCKVNKDDSSAPCAKCRSAIISKSGKITHRTLCVRTETLSSIVIVRPGLGFTSRTEGTKMFNIPPEDWADDTIRTIKMLQGLSQRPIVVEVRKFKPRDGDVTEKFWDDNGTLRPVHLEPYCLADIHQTADYFARYLFDTALYGLRDAAESSSGRLVRETYDMIVRHGEKLIARSKREPGNEQVTDECDFFLAVLKLVWSIRHMTGSVWLDGEEQLGMTAPKDPDYPLKNKRTGENAVMLPRMIVAQFDCLQNQKILPDQLKKVLMQLETRLSAAKEEWFSMYLAIFMLLHEIAVASKDRYRWAREHRQGPRYGGGKYAALGKYVENFQNASMPLLAYWSYYRVDNLGEVDWNDLTKTYKIKTLESEQIHFLRESVQMLREEAKDIPKTPAEGCWEHELFFVNRMFMHDWLHNYQTFKFKEQ